ncbi:hypothetical protein CDAR_90771, partial [Caerostris darwini]
DEMKNSNQTSRYKTLDYNLHCGTWLVTEPRIGPANSTTA